MIDIEQTVEKITYPVLPGYTNSGPRHWQTLWERRHPSLVRVAQREWDRPNRSEWVEARGAAVARANGPVVLIAHSLGCATAAHWLVTHAKDDKVVGALLVAPADVDQPGWPAEVVGFEPMPLKPLGVEGTVLASRNDPWVSLQRARAFSDAWGSRFVDVGAKGHINSDSDLEDWPEGWLHLQNLVRRLSPNRWADESEHDDQGW